MLRCGLLGRTLSHSYSPAIHALLGDYRYDLIELEPEALEAFVKTGPWDGLNVTIPYKKAVVPFCDELSPLAAALGSVNTMVKRDGKIYGDNTDAYGFEAMVHHLGVDCRGKKALVLGSGGASVTAQAVLSNLGAAVTVISRSGPDNYENLHRHSDAAILVNATPVGMYPKAGQSPVDLDRLPQLEAVLDIVYNPTRTRLILDAQARSIPCESGLLMLVAQAVRASEIFTGQAIPAETLSRVVAAVARDMENVTLIGMPGAGKTTVGRILAQKLGAAGRDAHPRLLRAVWRGRLPTAGDGSAPGAGAEVPPGAGHRRRLRHPPGKPGPPPAKRHGGLGEAASGGPAHRGPPSVPGPGRGGNLPPPPASV